VILEADDTGRRGREDVGGGPRAEIGVGQCQSVHKRECWIEMGGCGVDGRKTWESIAAALCLDWADLRFKFVGKQRFGQLHNAATEGRRETMARKQKPSCLASPIAMI
jgi:hypothetical protein